jgi:hypothetical protein
MPTLTAFISGICLATLIFMSVQFFRIGGSLNPMRNDTPQNYALIAMINLCVSVVAPVLILFLSPIVMLIIYAVSLVVSIGLIIAALVIAKRLKAPLHTVTVIDIDHHH